MNSAEKVQWVIGLWSLSTMYMFTTGFAWATGLWSIEDTPHPIIQVMFWGLFAGWILRITYLAGRKSK